MSSDQDRSDKSDSKSSTADSRDKDDGLFQVIQHLLGPVKLLGVVALAWVTIMGAFLKSNSSQNIQWGILAVTVIVIVIILLAAAWYMWKQTQAELDKAAAARADALAVPKTINDLTGHDWAFLGSIHDLPGEHITAYPKAGGDSDDMEARAERLSRSGLINYLEDTKEPTLTGATLSWFQLLKKQYVAAPTNGKLKAELETLKQDR